MSGGLEIIDEPLPGLYRLRRTIRGDARGFLARLFDAEDLGSLWTGPVAQINHTLTREKGTLRGMHLQTAPFADTKLVSVVAGRIFDVAVDLRPGSGTSMKSAGFELSADNGEALLIGPGFAHGFQTMSEDCVLIYAHAAPYRAECDAGVDALDPDLAIAWPLPVRMRSPRDEALPRAGDFLRRVA